MLPFAGYEMPIQYTGVIEEHLFCRENASIFDVSHMGQIHIYGNDRFNFIESFCVGNIKELKTGSGLLSVFLNENGGIIDDTIITNLPDYL
jgi:aminomethyltransferase